MSSVEVQLNLEGKKSFRQTLITLSGKTLSGKIFVGQNFRHLSKNSSLLLDKGRSLQLRLCFNKLFETLYYAYYASLSVSYVIMKNYHVGLVTEGSTCWYNYNPSLFQLLRMALCKFFIFRFPQRMIDIFPMKAFSTHTILLL